MNYSKYYKMLPDLFEEELFEEEAVFKKFDGACSSSPGSSISDFSYSPSYDDNDFLECVKYDEIELEKNPAFFTCVSPVHLVPSDAAGSTNSDANSNHSSVDDLESGISWESFLPNFTNDFSDDIINDIVKADINSSFFDLTINSLLLNKDNRQYSTDSEHCTKDVSTPLNSVRAVFNKPYHLDFDHCYSAPPKLEENEEKFMTYWDSPPCSPDSSETSSEVDVVTVSEEFIPVVPKAEVTHRITKKRGRKTVKKAQTPVSAKSLKAAMKNSRITNIRRTYRRKVNDSVETSPSNSVPSSAQSSRCNSDAEDAGKRANHNSSERKRREVLRTNLQNLRLSVPTTQNNAKAAKVLILNSATEYIQELESDEQDLQIVKRQEDQRRKHQQAELRSLIAYFKKHC